MSSALSRRSRPLLALALTLTAGLLGSAPAAQADTVTNVDEITTSTCQSTGTQWNVRYDLYFSDGQGRTLDQSNLASAEQSAQQFADDAGTLSDCAATVKVALITHTDPYTGPLPPSTGPFPLSPAYGYDSELVRVPGPQPPSGSPDISSYSGATDASQRTSVFPVTPGSDASQPSAMLLMHEWLKQVVGFYQARWPSQGVDGACTNPNYPTTLNFEGLANDGCEGDSLYFHDLMTGHLNDPSATGLPAGQWAYQGTPFQPRNVDPRLQVTRTGNAVEVRSDGPLSRQVYGLSEFTGTVDVTVNGGASTTLTLNPGQTVTYRGELTPGTDHVCATAVSAYWLKTPACAALTVSSDRTIGTRTRAGTLRASVRRGHLIVHASSSLQGHRARLRFVASAGGRTLIRVHWVKLAASSTVALPRMPRGYRLISVTVSAGAARRVIAL